MQPQLFTIKYLQSLVEPNGAWFSDNSRHALVGRCLLDMMEYFTMPELPNRFQDLADAHAIRLSVRCLSNRSLNRRDQLNSLAPCLNERLASLRKRRNPSPPFYGEDYWDWAAILECFFEAKDKNKFPDSIMTDEIFDDEMELFRESVQSSLSSGLTKGSDREWYGPATAAAAHKILKKWSGTSNRNLEPILSTLKKQALEEISNGTYRGFKVLDLLTLWHYGQVIHEFPDTVTTSPQALAMKNLQFVEAIDGKDYRSYVLSRVIQGAHEIKDDTTARMALQCLYDCQDLERPLAQGLIGDNIKGSLNALEALWPTLDGDGIARIGSMVDALAMAHSRENTVGVLVAIPEEFKAVQRAFIADGATEESCEDQATAFSQAKYRAVVRVGKSHIDSEDATLKLLHEDKAKWLFMVGVAGSLGSAKGVRHDSPVKSAGPQVGDVVLATSLAPHNIREKAREFVESAAVPFRGGQWTTIPTSPSLFLSASKAAAKVFPSQRSKVAIHEGVVVTSHLTDSSERKAAILSKWPGGLAVEEEGYVFGLLCLHDERAYMVIRGIMDFAGGDKKKKRAHQTDEDKRKQAAAQNAAKVAVEAIKILSKRWYSKRG